MEKIKSREGEGDQDSWRGVSSIEKEASCRDLRGEPSRQSEQHVYSKVNGPGVLKT